MLDAMKNSTYNQIVQSIDILTLFIISYRISLTISCGLYFYLEYCAAIYNVGSIHYCEAWTINEAIKKQLEAAVMQLLQRIMKIYWIQKAMNENFLRTAQAEQQLLKQIMKRQCSFLGHIIRKEGIKYQMGIKEIRRNERLRKKKTDLSQLVRQMLRQEKSGHLSFGRKQNFASCCDSPTRNYTTMTIIKGGLPVM